MKILLSAAGSLDGQVGGGQVYVQNLAKELQRRGRDLAVVCEDPPITGQEPFRIDWREFQGIKVAGIATNPDAVSAGDQWSGQSRFLQEALRQVVARVKPDVIHLNGMKAALTWVAMERSIGHVVTAHHGGIACPAGALLRPDDSICDKPMDPGWCVSCYCRQLNGPAWVRENLAGLPSWVYRPAGQFLNLLPISTYASRVAMYPWLVEQSIRGKQFALRHAQRFIAPSQAIARALIRNGTPAERVMVVPHGIDPLPAAPLPGLENRPVRFGYVGQINRAKGVRVLLEAFSRLPAGLAELHITGQPQRDGEQRYLDEAMQFVTGRDDVVLHGSVGHERIGEMMAGMDVVVLPSIFLEVFGLVVLEAFSVGRPVIVTDCGGPSDTVRDGVDSVVVPPNDVAALSAALRQLAELPQRVEELAANIKPVRTLVEHVDDLEAIYQAVLAENSNRRSWPGTAR